MKNLLGLALLGGAAYLVYQSTRAAQSESEAAPFAYVDQADQMAGQPYSGQSIPGILTHTVGFVGQVA